MDNTGSSFDFSSFIVSPPVPLTHHGHQQDTRYPAFNHPTTVAGTLSEPNPFDSLPLHHPIHSLPGMNEARSQSSSAMVPFQRRLLEAESSGFHIPPNPLQQQQQQQQAQGGSPDYSNLFQSFGQFQFNQSPQDEMQMHHNHQGQDATSLDHHHQQQQQQQSFDPNDYSAVGLDASTFSNVSFKIPSFLSGGPAGPHAQGPAILEPVVSASIPGANTKPAGGDIFEMIQPSQQQQQPQQVMPSSTLTPFSSGPNPGQMLQSQQSQQSPALQQPQQPATLPQEHCVVRDPSNPIYAPHGSSYLAINPEHLSAFSLPGGEQHPGGTTTSSVLSKLPSMFPTNGSSGTSGGPIDANSGFSSVDNNFPGLYSASGFDIISVLFKVMNRPNPQINIGPVDTSCSFLVADARQYDLPIVYASETFSWLTGYENHEILGRNCRFLQSPDGIVHHGSQRKHVDPVAIHHLRHHTSEGKECQTSITNFKKNGEPFTNLVTVIPISWESDHEIAYYVGFQIDPHQQPNNILQRMKNGTYVVNYAFMNQYSNLSFPIESDDLSKLGQSSSAEDNNKNLKMQMQPSATSLLRTLGNGGLRELDQEGTRDQWNNLLLHEMKDLIHVLSLKGRILYASANSSSMVEYDPNELINQDINSFIHPSDLVSVLRELKALSLTNSSVSLLYRMRRKHSGYVWVEAEGKLHIEQGKGRKSVILVGRTSDVYHLSSSELDSAGGITPKEFWSKISRGGYYLHATQEIQRILGLEPSVLIGTSFFDAIPQQYQSKVEKAIKDTANNGQPVVIRHKIRGRNNNPLDVVSNFFPNLDTNDMSMSLDSTTEEDCENGRCATVLCQTMLFESEMKRRQKAQTIVPFLREPKELSFLDSVDIIPWLDSSSSNTVMPNNGHNLFNELQVTSNNAWQYEVGRLRLEDKKLRAEHDNVVQRRRKRTRSSNDKSEPARSCANCFKEESPEWRRGPEGATLCNGCGLRWRNQNTSMPSRSPSLSGSGSGIAEAPPAKRRRPTSQEEDDAPAKRHRSR